MQLHIEKGAWDKHACSLARQTQHPQELLLHTRGASQALAAVSADCNFQAIVEGCFGDQCARALHASACISRASADVSMHQHALACMSVSSMVMMRIFSGSLSLRPQTHLHGPRCFHDLISWIRMQHTYPVHFAFAAPPCVTSSQCIRSGILTNPSVSHWIH